MSESRRVMLDKARAIATAKHPKDSCLGRALLRNNVFEGRLLSAEMGKICNQSRRQQMHLDQQKKRFLKNHVLPEPSILVERPPSPEIMRRALFPEYYDDDAYYFDPTMPPHYMKPRDLNNRPPSTLVTMDMFRVQPRRKVNVWEEAMLEKEKPHFKSTVRPSTRLTAAEQKDLQKSWSLHKRNKSAANPTLSSTSLVLSEPRSSSNIIPSLSQSTRSKSLLQLKSASDHIRISNKLPPSNNESGTFITELPAFRTDYEEDEQKQGKVSFVETQDDVINAKKGKKRGKKSKKKIVQSERKKTPTKLFEILLNG